MNECVVGQRLEVPGLIVVGIAVLLSGLVGCQREAIRYEVDDWPLKHTKGHVVETDHYRIFTTVADPVMHQASAEIAEYQFRRLSHTLSVTPKAKMNVYVFQTRRQWEAFTRAQLGHKAHRYLQIRDGGYAVDDICVLHYLGRYATLTVLAHELVHQYLDCATSDVPPAWLNEGLACLLESHEWDGETPVFTTDKNHFRRQTLSDALLGKQTFEIEQLLATHAGEVAKLSSAKVSAYYSQLWALMQFLEDGAKGEYRGAYHALLGELGTDQLRTRGNAYLAASSSDRQMSFGEAVFRQYITDDVDEFERKFNEFMVTLVGW